jgi:hypothetical protein
MNLTKTSSKAQYRKLHLSLIIGYISLCLATIIAWLRPATGYESSIYGGTPSSFWVGILIALTAALAASFRPNRTHRVAGVALAGMSIITIVALPIIRGYYWLGEGDSLTHIGFTLNIQNGLLPLQGFRYPAVHTIGILISDVTGVSLFQSLLLVIPAFVLLFFLFVPLAVRELVPSLTTTTVGVFSGLFLLQMNFLGVHTQVHPTSQALMIVPLILFLFIANYLRSDRRLFLPFVTAVTALVLSHPQQAANLLILLSSMTVIGLIHSQRWTGDSQTRYWDLLVPTLATGALFWLWVGNLARFETALAGFVSHLLLVETGTATEVTSRSVSLSQIGGSIEGIFLKIFSVALLFCLLTGSMMIEGFNRVFISRTDINRKWSTIPDTGNETGTVLILYLLFGVVGIIGIFLAYLFANITSQYFRHYGFMMVIISITGSIPLAQLVAYLSERFRLPSKNTVYAIVVFLLLLLSIPVIHPSPYIYQPSGHVPESQVNGYETSFDYRDENIVYRFVRSSASRYHDATHGWKVRESKEDVNARKIPDHFADRGLINYFDQRAYIGVTGADRVRDPAIFNGLRFNQSDFQYLESEKGINKIQTSNEFDLYLVEPQPTRSRTESERIDERIGAGGPSP